MLPKVIKIACIAGSVAFLFHAALAPFYETEGFRFTASIVFIAIAILLFSFLRRQRWSWLLVLIFTASHVIISIIFPPTEKFYGSLTLIGQILVIIESLACIVIFVSMLFPATKVWFTGSDVIKIIKEDEFHKGEVLEVSYRNSFWDAVWFSFYQTPRSRTAQISFVVIILGVALIFFSSLSDTNYSFSIRFFTYVVFLTLIFLGLIMLSLVILGIKYILRLFFARAKQECKLSVSERGALVETPSKNKEIRWSGIEKIKQNSKYIMLYLSDSEAILLPKRTFTKGSDADKFFDYSYSCFEKSKNENLLK